MHWHCGENFIIKEVFKVNIYTVYSLLIKLLKYWYLFNFLQTSACIIFWSPGRVSFKSDMSNSISKKQTKRFKNLQSDYLITFYSVFKQQVYYENNWQNLFQCDNI